MYCFNCKQKIDLPDRKVPFRATCENCGKDLHICKNCHYFSPGKPNDCLNFDSLPVRDKEKFNFCEEFKPRDKLPTEKKVDQEKLKHLFGDLPSKKNFNGLFND